MAREISTVNYEACQKTQQIYKSTPSGRGPFPAVIHNPGRGLDHAGYSLQKVMSFFDALAGAGIATLVPVRRDEPFPAHVAEVKTAVGWIKHNCAELNINPKRLAIMGMSRGAALALAAGIENIDLRCIVLLALQGRQRRTKSIIECIPMQALPPVLNMVGLGDKYGMEHFWKLNKVLQRKNIEHRSFCFPREVTHDTFKRWNCVWGEHVIAFLQEKLACL